ncbi:MAG: spermidine/putrescine transport system permease protein [Candidatus Midichloriaceae bacterium]|jgi:spermidine/putrescine transport system permease protein
MNNRWFFKKFIIVNSFFLLIISTIVPNLLIILLSFTKVQNGEMFNSYFTLVNFKNVFSPLFITVYINSMIIAIKTVFISIILGYPVALIIYVQNNKYIKYLLLILIIIPFWTSSLIRTYSMVYLLKLNGVINYYLIYFGIINEPYHMLYDRNVVIFGFVYNLIPFMIMPIYLSLRKIDKSIIEAAMDLGASKLQIFFKVIFPLSYSGVISGCSMVMLSSFSMFYISDLLGGSKNIMIGNIVKNQILITQNWNLGSAITVLFYFVVIFWVIVQKKYHKLDLYSDAKNS